MFDEMDAKLRESKVRIRSKQKLGSMLRLAQDDVREQRSRCSVLADRLAREKADVDKLDGLSLTGLFYSVLGTKDERLEKERQEFLAEKLKHEEAVWSLEDAQQEVQRIQDELVPFANAAAEYERLINEKEKLLAETDDDRAEQLLTFSEKLADLMSDNTELREAIQAGQEALNSLEQVSSELGSATNWGTWDMVGGGIIATMAKHSKIDSAKEHAHHAQRQLRRFQEELADADQRLQVTLEIDGFSKFADFFFDGLIADWVVQSKIQQASSACSTAISRVTSAVSDCQRRLLETEEDVQALNRKRKELIEQA